MLNLEKSRRVIVANKFRLSLAMAFALCFICGKGLGQQIPVFNHYTYNPSFFNPAAMGDGFIGVQYRSQFLGLNNADAPKTFSINTDLSQLLNLSDKKIGLGVSLYADKVQMLNRLKAKVSFAYHLIDNDAQFLAAGIEAGWFNQRIDFSDVRIRDAQDVVLTETTSTKSVFDGGFGLRFLNTTSEGQVLKINIAAPQLFTSDLDYEDGAFFNVNAHLLATASYKIPIAQFALEPHLMYRDILGERSLKKGNTDIAIRAHFLEDRFWVAGGTRLAAHAYNFSFGLTIADQFQLQGTFETHEFLGSTWETLIAYKFSSFKKSPQGPWEDIKRAADEVDKIASLVNKDLKKANDFLDKAKFAVGDKNEIARNLRLAEAPLQSAATNVELLLDPAVMVEERSRKAEDDYIAAKKAGTTGKATERTWTNLSSLSYDNYNLVTELISSYRQTDKEISALKRKYGANQNQLKSLLAKTDADGLQSYFQRGLDKAIGVPKNTRQVQVEKTKTGFRLTYEYADNENQYKLDGAISRTKFMADHMVKQITALKNAQKNITSISINANLQARRSSLESTTINSKYKEDEFGYQVNVPFTFTNNANDKFSEENVQVQVGAINLLQLAALKMYGWKRYFIKKGLSAEKELLQFGITAPNYEQTAAQEFSIVIEFE